MLLEIEGSHFHSEKMRKQFIIDLHFISVPVFSYAEGAAVDEEGVAVSAPVQSIFFSLVENFAVN